MIILLKLENTYSGFNRHLEEVPPNTKNPLQKKNECNVYFRKCIHENLSAIDNLHCDHNYSANDQREKRLGLKAVLIVIFLTEG